MPAVTAPATASTLATLVTRIRELVGDPSTTVTTPRFSDTIVRARIDEILAEMWNKLTEDPSGYLEYVDVAYDSGASSMILPVGFEAHSIFKVEDIADSANPKFIDYMANMDVDRFPNKQGWSLGGPASSANPNNTHIILRPKSDTGTTLRVWRVKYFPRTLGGATTDTHVLPVSHEELICLGAAVRLQEIDDEIPVARLRRLDGLWEDFRNYTMRMRGPAYVRNVRRYK